MTDERHFAGRTAVVTGASSGIGRAIAERLGAAGVSVYLAGRSAAAMEESCGRIGTAGGRAVAAVVDVRDPAQVTALVERAAAESGRLDVMVNNAGVSFPRPIVDGEVEEWRAMLETNVLALLAGCQAAVRAMRRCKTDGRIVNISSIAAQRPDSGVYGATKHAVNCISATLRRELEDDPIRVINVMPGAIATNFARNFDPAVLAGLIGITGLEVEVKPGERLPDEALDRIQASMREILGSPDEVADAVLYAIAQPNHVNIADIVVRPAKQLNL